MCLIFLCLATSASEAAAEVKLPSVFGDHMVLQQDQKVPVWGIAAPNEKVVIAFGGRTVAGTADAAGKWRVELDPSAATTSGTTLSATGKNTLKFEDVLVGEVWLCSGQSNMEYPLARSHTGREDYRKAADAQIRFFRAPRIEHTGYHGINIKNGSGHTVSDCLIRYSGELRGHGSHQGRSGNPGSDPRGSLQSRAVPLRSVYRARGQANVDRGDGVLGTSRQIGFLNSKTCDCPAASSGSKTIARVYLF